jgi:ABC-type sulfate transport system permease component
VGSQGEIRPQPSRTIRDLKDPDGSVVFVSGNMPYRTEIAPVLIVARLEEFAYGEATAVAVVLLVISFSMLIIIRRNCFVIYQ